MGRECFTLVKSCPDGAKAHSVVLMSDVIQAEKLRVSAKTTSPVLLLCLPDRAQHGAVAHKRQGAATSLGAEPVLQQGLGPHFCCQLVLLLLQAVGLCSVISCWVLVLLFLPRRILMPCHCIVLLAPVHQPCKCHLPSCATCIFVLGTVCQASSRAGITPPHCWTIRSRRKAVTWIIICDIDIFDCKSGPSSSESPSR